MFFFVPEGIYRLDMTKKRGNPESPENEPKMVQKADFWPKFHQNPPQNPQKLLVLVKSGYLFQMSYIT